MTSVIGCVFVIFDNQEPAMTCRCKSSVQGIMAYKYLWQKMFCYQYKKVSVCFLFKQLESLTMVQQFGVFISSLGRMQPNRLLLHCSLSFRLSIQNAIWHGRYSKNYCTNLFRFFSMRDHFEQITHVFSIFLFRLSCLLKQTTTKPRFIYLIPLPSACYQAANFGAVWLNVTLHHGHVTSPFNY